MWSYRPALKGYILLPTSFPSFILSLPLQSSTEDLDYSGHF